MFIYAFFMVGLAKSYGLLLMAFQKKFEVSTAMALLPMSVSAIVYAFGGKILIKLSRDHHSQIF